MNDHSSAWRIAGVALLGAGAAAGASAQPAAPAAPTGTAATQPAFTASFVTADDGTRLAVREYGNPQGPAIVFVHGIAQSQLAFARQMQAPAPGRRDPPEPFAPQEGHEQRQRGDRAQQEDLADRIGAHQPLAHRVVGREQKYAEQHEDDADDGTRTNLRNGGRRR